MRTIVSLALTVNLIVLLIGCTPAEVPDAEEPQKMSEIPAESGAPATGVITVARKTVRLVC